MPSELEKHCDRNESSDIQNYFVGSTVFVTGGTGFIGKLIIEKLLRTCTGVKRLYVLIRIKKGKAAEDRLTELLDDVVFSALTQQQPEFRKKVTLVPGDCALPGLGMSDEHKQILINEVNCVIHSAATVRFDATLRNATYINVRAVSDILALAKKMKKLSSFVHVSTAYCYCIKNSINEVFYDPPYTSQQLMSLVDTFDDKFLDSITQTMIKPWPNTYVFTKCISEDVIKKEGKGLPISVVRPGIIMSTVKEPLVGWFGNIFGLIGLIIAIIFGFVRTLQFNTHAYVNLVPADFSTNCILAAAWDTSIKKTHEMQKQKEENNNSQTHDIVIYNNVITDRNQLSVKNMIEYLDKHGRELPTSKIIWYPFLITNSNSCINKICALFLHTIPAYIVDSILFCMGKKTMMVDAYNKFDKMVKVLHYFLNRQWVFTDDNTCNLWQRMSLKDKEYFNFDVETLDWNKYFYNALKGGRTYFCKETLETLPAGKKKLRMFQILHYGLCTLILLLLLTFLWKIFI